MGNATDERIKKLGDLTSQCPVGVAQAVEQTKLISAQVEQLRTCPTGQGENSPFWENQLCIRESAGEHDAVEARIRRCWQTPGTKTSVPTANAARESTRQTLSVQHNLHGHIFL